MVFIRIFPSYAVLHLADRLDFAAVHRAARIPGAGSAVGPEQERSTVGPFGPVLMFQLTASVGGSGMS
jgi:hypothetical protein